jgi:hypothetical protein
LAQPLGAIAPWHHLNMAGRAVAIALAVGVVGAVAIVGSSSAPADDSVLAIAGQRPGALVTDAPSDPASVIDAPPAPSTTASDAPPTTTTDGSTTTSTPSPTPVAADEATVTTSAGTSSTRSTSTTSTTLVPIVTYAADIGILAPQEVVTPTRLIVPALSIDAPVIAAGVNGDNELDVPPDARTLAWYRYGPAPGKPGSAVIAATSTGGE